MGLFKKLIEKINPLESPVKEVTSSHFSHGYSPYNGVKSISSEKILKDNSYIAVPAPHSSS